MKNKKGWIFFGLGGVTAFLLMVLISGLFPQEKSISYRVSTLYSVDSEAFRRVMGDLMGPPLIDGNEVTAYENGDEIFPAMLGAIDSARKSITFETYIYWSGKIGDEFSEALARRAKAGVPVHVILDWLGSAKMDQKALEKMQSAGVEVVRYRPLHWYSLHKFNNRTHRKILVVDGETAFTGGVGISDQWSGRAQDPEHWRDSHFRVRGPVVAQMQSVFLDNWIKTRGQVLHGEGYFPPLVARGTALAQVFKSSSRGGSESVRLMYLLSIASSHKSIQISNSYFVPDDLAIQALLEARKRGVSIEIIVPGRYIDTEVTRQASRSLWGELLKAGVEIYEYQPTMYHRKVLLVDGVWTSVGSTNFDNRSFRLNDEANLNVWDKKFAEAQGRIFERDKATSKRVTLEGWHRRPLWSRAKEAVSRLLRHQL